jgi:hypothetical protein
MILKLQPKFQAHILNIMSYGYQDQAVTFFLNLLLSSFSKLRV